MTDMFRCCDPTCTGLVTEDQFQAVLNDTLVPEAGITERQLDSVTNYYRAYDDKIDYRRMAQMFDSTLSLQEQYQLNYVTSRDQLKKPKAVNKLSEKDEEHVKEIWEKVVRRADRHILSTLASIFDKVIIISRLLHHVKTILGLRFLSRNVFCVLVLQKESSPNLINSENLMHPTL